jgi:hypothetical protein
MARPLAEAWQLMERLAGLHRYVLVYRQRDLPPGHAIKEPVTPVFQLGHRSPRVMHASAFLGHNGLHRYP